MAWTAPRTWTAGEVVDAAMMNAHVRDNLKAIGDPWTAYTPTWTATTTNPDIGNGTIVGHYIQAGNLVIFRAVITAGSTTTFGTGTYLISLPVTAGGAGRSPMAGVLRDDSAAADYPIMGLLVSGVTSVSLRTWPTAAGAAFAQVTPTVPVTLAANDSLTITGTYEAA